MNLSQLVLSISALSVFMDVIGILAIIGLGSFLIILVADLIISIFDKHEGVFFNKQKKVKKEKTVAYEPENTAEEYLEQENKVEILPFEEETTVTTIDDHKEQEEKALIENTVVEHVEQVPEGKTFEEVLHEAAEIVAKEEQANQPQIAVKAIEQVVETPVEEPKEEKEVVEEKVEVVEEKPEPVEKVKVVKVDDLAEVKKLRSLRKDILIKKQSAMVMDKEHDRVAKEYEEKLNEKQKELEELQNYKKRVQKNRANIIQVRNESLKKNNQLIEEKEQLKKEVENLKKRTRDDGKPYFTKEYYIAKLERLEEELKENDKELKDNKKELLPLRRVKKAYDRDSDRVRRKEVMVARQRTAVYGVNSTNNVDPAKKEKLDQEVKLLKELKDSVASCEQVLQENKDRIPVLEKTNKILTKHQEKLESDIESTKEAILWYVNNAGKKETK